MLYLPSGGGFFIKGIATAEHPNHFTGAWDKYESIKKNSKT